MISRRVEYVVHTEWREPEEVTVVTKTTLGEARSYVTRNMNHACAKTDIVKMWITKKIINVVETEVE